MKISVVINTFNEEKNLGRCLESVKNFGDEIIVVDMHSTDKTVEIAKSFKAKVYYHDQTRYVEPARNFALRQAQGDWILLIDADEELPPSLALKLKEVTNEENYSWVDLPRKNIIFGQWIEHSRWWPDYLVRFFKKGKVKFSDKIHLPPRAMGEGKKLAMAEENALIHHNFQSVSQYLERLNRYSDIQANELARDGYKFVWQDILVRPSHEFFSRFFAGEGYQDGLHGLALALLQAFSELAVYLKVWEQNKFKAEKIEEYDGVVREIVNDLLFWQRKTVSGFFEKIRLRIKEKI